MSFTAVQFALSASRNEYERAFIDEPLCRREANPAAASGNDRNLLCKFV